MRSLKILVLGCASSLVLVSQSVAQTTQPVQINDVLFGLNRAAPAETTQHIRGSPTTVNGGQKVGSTWAAPFVQSLQFDNLDGFRHAWDGNLLGVNFGTATVGFSIYNMETRRVPNSTTPGAFQTMFDFPTYNASNPPLVVTRGGSISVSPQNNRIALTGVDATPNPNGSIGYITVLDYNAGATPGTGAGASVTNGRQLTGVVQSGSSSNTTATTWLDNDNFLTLTHPVNNNPNAPAQGQLQKVTVTGGGLNAAGVATIDFPGGTAAFSSLAYEPTVSPFVYLAVSQFPVGALGNTQNRLYVLDPNNNFTSVGSFDYSSSMNTAREIAFDSKGNLFLGQFGNTSSVPLGGAIQVILDANEVATISNNDSQFYYTQDQAAALSAQFSGLDVASAMLDYKTANVTVNVRTKQVTVPYFPGTVEDPTTSIRGRLLTGRNGGAWNGTGSAIISTDAAAASNRAIGYAKATEIGVTSWGGVTIDSPAVVMAYTFYGDTDLNGEVNFDDYSRTDNGFNTGGDTWFEGDFDYNALVNFDDYSLIDNAFNTQDGSLARAISFVDGSDRSLDGMNTPALQKVVEHFEQFGQPYANSFLNNVPEPASLSVASLLAASALARRRRVFEIRR